MTEPDIIRLNGIEHDPSDVIILMPASYDEPRDVIALRDVMRTIKTLSIPEARRVLTWGSK